MKTRIESTVGENFNVRDMLLMGRRMKLHERIGMLGAFMTALDDSGTNLLRREMLSPADRSVLVRDPHSGIPREMLMFGSNNYLGLASHPAVLEAIRRALDEYGAGIGGPPLLNGYSSLHRQLEERLAGLKRTESALIYSSGYGANVGIATALLQKNDVVLYDACSHASFVDGMAMSRPQQFSFRHNDLADLEGQLQLHADHAGDLYVAVEGVYSMDGDIAPLHIILPLCRRYGAILILDDAHGTGVLGATGSGTAEACGVEGLIDVTMGTFSKSFGMSGGFVAASRDLIEYMRVFSRSYMFSASLPPVVAAAVLAGLDVIEAEPELHSRLADNVAYTCRGLASIGLPVSTDSAIIALRVPADMNIRAAAAEFHDRGIFVNSIEYPAVPVSEQRFRISLMATHTLEDIDRLVDTVAAVWANTAHRREIKHAA